MAQPIVRYDGDFVTCYPGSNQVDNGKLNLEFNMARFITRLSSKNFCIKNPSFTLTIENNATTNLPEINIAPGEASINGMDLIITQDLRIATPSESGTFYLAFKLARDSSDNVLGNLVVGIDTTFQGVYLTYYNEKPDPLVDMDMLYLGEISWDGTNITNIKEDEDKYGRLWAEDILSKVLDPMHPEITRLNLQQYLFNLPNWYVSKEGDEIFGPLIFKDNRVNNKSGILINTNDISSNIIIKDPSSDNNKLQIYGDVNGDGIVDQSDIDLINLFIAGTEIPTEIQNILADVNGDGIVDEKDVSLINNYINNKGNPGFTGKVYFISSTDQGINIKCNSDESNIGIANSKIYSTITDENILHITNSNHIELKSNKSIFIRGDESVKIGTTSESPVMEFKDDNVTVSSNTASDLLFNINYVDSETIRNTIGKTIWQYKSTNKYLSLLNTELSYLEINPSTLFRSNVRVQSSLILGGTENDTTPQTLLQRLNWYLRDGEEGGNYTHFTPLNTSLINTKGTISSLTTKNSDNSQWVDVRSNGEIDILGNAFANPKITFRDGNAANDIFIEKIKNEKRLNIQGNLSVNENFIAKGEVSGSGLTTNTGIITFVRGTNNATISKDSNYNNLRTSNDLYVGTNGTSNLFAGNTMINGNLGVGGNTYENANLKVDNLGNVVSKGTITATKIYNSVYNGFGEIFRKDKNEIIEYGDVVYIGYDGLAHVVNNEEALNSIIGICSNSIGLQFGGENIPKEEQVEVEMVGQIWVKTDEIDITPGTMLKFNVKGKIEKCLNRKERDAIALTNVENGKVRIVYNG